MPKICFPKSFRFGVADADLQVIGEKSCLENEQSEETEWRRYALDSGKVFENTTPDAGVDRYNLWKDDIGLIRGLGVRHYRTSVSMARLLKRSGEVNGPAIKWYRQYFASLKKSDLRVYATLYHWELPNFLAEEGGWTNRKTVDWFVKHARVVHEHLGEFVDEYFLLNEPWCSSFLGYHLGIHPPGTNKLTDALVAAHNLLLAQGVATRVLLSIDPSLKISTVLNVGATYAASETLQDQLAAMRAEAYQNTWFSDPIFLGAYPEILLEHFGNKVPRFAKSDMESIQIGHLLNSMGLNYYRGDVVRHSDKGDLNTESVLAPDGSINDLGWPIFEPPHYREGLTDVLSQFWWSYRNHGLKRLYITENGMALESPWDGKSEVVEDDRRVSFLREHLRQVHQAIIGGVPVEAYFLWTLMDNYEWCHGYKPKSCFGIVHVDRRTMKRVPKRSAVWYSNVVKSGSMEFA